MNMTNRQQIVTQINDYTDVVDVFWTQKIDTRGVEI